MDAITLLKEDHKKVKKMLTELTETTNRATKTRVKLVEDINKEIQIHTTLEEEIFYPAFKDSAEKVDDEAMYFEALEEHRAAGELVLPDLSKTDPGSSQFAGRAKVLQELIEHHIKDEEKEMFPRARKLLDKSTIEELGKRMEVRKKELSAQLG